MRDAPLVPRLGMVWCGVGWGMKQKIGSFAVRVHVHPGLKLKLKLHCIYLLMAVGGNGKPYPHQDAPVLNDSFSDFVM